MAYLPSQDEWNELLSAPHVARLTRAHGETDLELTLVARCRTLELKYALQSSRLNIFPFRSVRGVLGYGLIVPDDEVRPMVLWAACKDKSEYSILEDLNTENTLNIHLFNEACVNVASAKFRTKPGKQYGVRLLSPSFEPDKDAIFADDVRSGIEAGILDAASMVTLTRLGPWYGAISHLIGGQSTPFALELLADEEGGHQEQLTGWLADSVQPDLLKINLKYEDGKKNKEFADVTLSCTFRTVLVESKTLAILRRSQIPLRVDLHSDVDKKITKAVKQLKGGCRSLHSGKKIIDETGQEVTLFRSAPAHAICLIPDHSLLSNKSAYAAKFCQEFAKSTGDIFHLMDIAQLYRSVQAAQMLSSHIGGSVIENFDRYLMKRSELVVDLDSVVFDMALDLREEGRVRIRVTEGYE